MTHQKDWNLPAIDSSSVQSSWVLYRGQEKSLISFNVQAVMAGGLGDIRRGLF